MRYGLWWVERATAGARGGIHAFTRAAAREIRGAADATLRLLPARAGRSTASEPWDDRTLFTGLTVFSLVAVAVSLLLGFGVAEWMRTEPEALLIAGLGAVVVGAVLLPLGRLVFTSRRRRRAVAEERE
ncbi:hypothetical protein [Nocardiopsis lambiniae]|uniref:Uncharacterized protein n=1 Tax=Nocardiopsis lambiniae TaxID=3075539 RepID=A0ABU2MA54_9ACTN|nr:hypothetical protein [Nocardiopsis sp. DSM 44743]MDT0329554.1 hypothetical protein [Nocardiopsis sp. DSM 44743]